MKDYNKLCEVFKHHNRGQYASILLDTEKMITAKFGEDEEQNIRFMALACMLLEVYDKYNKRITINPNKPFSLSKNVPTDNNELELFARDLPYNGQYNKTLFSIHDKDTIIL